jgi:hypothetical protein
MAVEQRLIEKVEILDGSRSANTRKQAAVRIADMEELLRIKPLKAKSLTVAPTAEQYNTLLEDTRQIHSLLKTIADALAGRLRG